MSGVSRPSRRWFAFAAWAVLIFALVPFANDLQAWVGRRLGGGATRWAVAAALALAVAAAGRWLLIAPQHREGFSRGESLRRFLWIAAIAAIAGAWGWRLRVAAEPVHLVSYAVLGALAFRALSCHLRDRGVYPAAAALVAIVGTLDEVVQWLVPGRYFDLRDVGIDAAAGALVQLLIQQGIRPRTVGPGWSRRSLRFALRLLAVEAALLLLCLANTPARIEWYAARVPGLSYLGGDRSTRMIEYGHLYVDPEVGRFKSRLSAAELARADRERGAEAARLLRRYRDRWGELDRAYPPWREPLASEFRGHLFHRDRYRIRAREARGDPAERRRLATLAWRESLLLERHFPHTLSRSGRALKPAARRRLRDLQAPEAEFVSEVGDWLVTGVSEAQARGSLLAVLAGLVLADLLSGRGRKGRGQRSDLSDRSDPSDAPDGGSERRC